MDKQSISLEIPYREKVSRLFVFRFFWMVVLFLPMMLLGFGLYILGVLQFFYMLILGKRQKTLWESARRYFAWMMDWNAYFGVLTDKRPNFWW